MIICSAPDREKRCCGRTGERTPLVPLKACAGWAETVNCHAHPRILLPQNRCFPEPLAAPFPHQPEPRCNTLDFASKVVCQRGAAAPLETRAKEEIPLFEITPAFSYSRSSIEYTKSSASVNVFFRCYSVRERNPDCPYLHPFVLKSAVLLQK